LTINLDIFAFTSRQTLLWDILWLCSVLIASANGPAPALNEYNVLHGLQNRAAEQMKTKYLI